MAKSIGDLYCACKGLTNLNRSEPSMKLKNLLFFLAGPLAFTIIQLIHLEGLSPQGRAVLACSIWVAIWWMTEAVELEVTSLLPIIIFPLSGALKVEAVASSYGNSYIYLFLGGFILGLAVERCNLHKRIAYYIISHVGKGEKRIILGFMIATGFLSMWLSNTATTIMMLPIGLSVISHLGDKRKNFAKSLMLGIAYAASIGGMATLIGTPPNIILAGIIKESFGFEISFLTWMMFALPFSAILLFLTWIVLTSYKTEPVPDDEEIILIEPGRMTVVEKRVLTVFLLTAFFWITRTFLWQRIIPGLDDTIIAMAGAVLMFLIPSGNADNEKLMNWDTARKLPWGILLIFGAGLTIALGFSSTDLTSWLAGLFVNFKAFPAFIILLLVIASINFLTEITSNTATASMVLPLLVTLAASLSMDPLHLMIGAALAASCAFMLPVATPPNAIVFSSGSVKIADMIKAGIVADLISIALIFLFVQYWWPVVFTR